MNAPKVTSYKLTSPAGTMALYCTPEEWAAETKNRLLALGCSEAYASRVARRIGRAT